MGLKDDGGSEDAQVPAPIGPPDAPGGEEGEAEEGEIDEQRQRVALRKQDAGRVQQLGVLRVEPVGEDRLRVVQAGHGVALDHVHREGHVVPERVEVEDAAAQGVFGGEAPMGEYQSYCAEGD